MGTWFAKSRLHERPLTPYAACVRELSERLVRVQRPIRVLESIRWDLGIERAFFARGCRALPPVPAEYYRSRPMPFAPAHKLGELRAIERDVHIRLGADSAPGTILIRMCHEYRLLVRLLACRGTSAFGTRATELYGSALERWSGHTSWNDLARRLGRACAASLTPPEPTLPASLAAKLLAARLAKHFHGTVRPRIRLVDGLSADATAGPGYIKLRRDARFTPRDVRLLEVHEGWVHLATSINGLSQPACSFLAKGSPSSTQTQEGLALATEILAGVSSPERLGKVCRRLRGIALAEQGANFLEVFRFFVDDGCSPRDGYQLAHRVFRGGLPENCGPFTKDACYLKGLVLLLSHLQRASRMGQAWTAPLLFCGKTALADLGRVQRMREERLIAEPRHVPPSFLDPANFAAGLARWRRTRSPALDGVFSAMMRAHDATVHDATDTKDSRSAA